MTNVHGYAFLLDFPLGFRQSSNCRNTMKKIFCLSLYFKIWNFIFRQLQSRPYDVELVTTGKNSCSKDIYWSATTNSKCLSEENVIFLLVYEFREWLLHFDEENKTKMAALWPTITFPIPESDHFSSPTETRICGLADCWKPLCPGDI